MQQFFIAFQCNDPVWSRRSTGDTMKIQQSAREQKCKLSPNSRKTLIVEHNKKRLSLLLLLSLFSGALELTKNRFDTLAIR